MTIDELFTDLVPYRPRIREEMPLLQWVKEYQDTGFLKIDVYTSKKARENPNGYKASKVKSALINGFQSMTQAQRTLVQDTFSDSFTSLALDSNGHRQLVVSTSEVMEHARKNRGWRIEPLVKKIIIPKASDLDSSAKSSENIPQPEKSDSEPKSKSGKKKQKKS